jgi:hypothetical protein
VKQLEVGRVKQTPDWAAAVVPRKSMKSTQPLESVVSALIRF